MNLCVKAASDEWPVGNRRYSRLLAVCATRLVVTRRVQILEVETTHDLGTSEREAAYGLLCSGPPRLQVTFVATVPKR